MMGPDWPGKTTSRLGADISSEASHQQTDPQVCAGRDMHADGD